MERSSLQRQDCPGCRCMWRTAVATYIVRVTIETAMAAATDHQSRAATSGSPTSTQAPAPRESIPAPFGEPIGESHQMEHRSTPVAPWAIRADLRSRPARARHASSLARKETPRAESRPARAKRYAAPTRARELNSVTTYGQSVRARVARVPVHANLAAPRYAQPVRPPAPAPVSGARRGRRLHPSRWRGGRDPGAKCVPQVPAQPAARADRGRAGGRGQLSPGVGLLRSLPTGGSNSGEWAGHGSSVAAVLPGWAKAGVPSSSSACRGRGYLRPESAGIPRRLSRSR